MIAGGRSRLRRRILLTVALPLVFSLLVAAASTLYLVDRLLVRQVQGKLNADLRSARELYDARVERLADFLRFATNLPSVRRALAEGDVEGLRAELQALRVRQGADVLSAADRLGRIVARARNPAEAGDEVTHLAPVRRALVGEPAAGTLVLSAADLQAEGPDLARQARIAVVPTPRARPGAPGQVTEGLALFAAAPVLDGAGRVVGALYAADLLNQDFALVDKIRQTVFGEETYEGRPLGTATLFLGDVRVSTNVPTTGGPRAVGTRVSEEVADRVLRRRSRWVDRAFVVNDWYLSAYEPLTDGEGEVLGILYVGVLERPYRTLAGTSLAVVGGIHLAGGAVVLLLAAALARSVTRPLRGLTTGARRVASGDLTHHLPVEREDEIGELAREFNAMTASLRQRDGAIEELTRGLEQKVRERSAELERRNEELLRARSELLDLTEKQKDTNRELAASLERLQATQEELVRSGKLAALGALAAGVAHEINNPLAVIQGNVELLALRTAAHPELGDEVTRIADQVERMQRIVSSLLTFARKEESGSEPVDLGELVRETLDLAEPQARQGRVTLRARLAPDLLPVHGDPGRLRQVFTNLVVNALQAMPAGGALEVTTGPTEDGAGVYAAFADTGPGIARSERERVWNPFYTTKPSGTGLGLSICHAIVEEHGGRILLESEPGRGATFTVVLPRGA